MSLRLLSAAAAIWLGALLLFAAGLAWNGAPRHPRRPPAQSALARSLNGTQPVNDWRWSVTHAQASQGALVVEVDVMDLAEALASAQAIVEPVRTHYREVLIYLRQTGSVRPFAAKRVQWTPGRGYVETALGPPAL
jgi:hypothetical protein